MLGKIILLVVLIVVNGLFASSEIAFLSLDKRKLKEKVKEQHKKSIKIQKLLEDPSVFLATIQIGITLAGFLASAFAAETFADMIVENLSVTFMSATSFKSLVVVIVTLILSYFTLVFGELVPKKLALAYPEKISYFMVNFISILMKVAYPFVWLLTASTNLVSNLLRIKKKEDEKLTEEEIKKIIISGRDDGAIEDGEKNLIFNIFTLNDKEASDAMTKKEDMVIVDIKSDAKEILSVIKKYKFTRFPVKEQDTIVGILNVKDLLIDYSKNAKLDLHGVMRKPVFVYGNEKIDDVFKMMQNTRQAMSIVKDTNDAVIGLITLEDAIEELVGDIFDEYDALPNNS
ncbi:MAG: hemolysin family protein [Clostridia bacterium]|nr:hemolysin family protein [Clostridia bacterium]